jgi:hypothetical protein
MSNDAFCDARIAAGIGTLVMVAVLVFANS